MCTYVLVYGNVCDCKRRLALLELKLTNLIKFVSFRLCFNLSLCVYVQCNLFTEIHSTKMWGPFDVAEK